MLNNISFAKQCKYVVNYLLAVNNIAKPYFYPVCFTTFQHQTLYMKKYSNWYLLGFTVFIVTAIFSSGYHNHDEHFQVLEFCNYKLGLSSSTDLPWEFGAKIRPGIQPLLAWSLAKVLTVVNLYNPFTLAFLLRLFMAILSWLAITRLIKLLLPDFVHERGKVLFILCSLLLWFVPYTSVRFSAEGFSGMLFCFAAYNILLPNQHSGKRYGQLLVAGALLGFAWYARVQLGLALVGMAIWILFVAKWQFRYYSVMLLSFIAAVGLGFCADYWLYHEWVFTPYRYFDVNILHSKAAEFGVSPWWGYFELFIMNGVPPISIVLLILFFRGVWKKPLHLFTLCCLAFTVGHFFIGHKEMRFLFPMVISFVYIVSIGIDSLLQLQKRKLYTIGLKVLVFMNIALLVYRGVSPAQDTVNFYKYMYQQTPASTTDSTILYSVGSSPYNIITLNVNFYKHPQLAVRVIDSISQIPVGTQHANSYFFSPRILDAEVIKQYGMTPVYSTLPAWLRNFNFNNWQERTKISTLYKIK